MRWEKSVLKPAVFSRIVLIILQYVGNIVIPDHEPVVFHDLKLKTNETKEDVVEHFLGGLVRWDAHYFMHIAKYGYTYENTLAFFPVYPMCGRIMSIIINFLIPCLNFDSVLLLVFVILNILCFLISAQLLFRLTSIMFNKNIAYRVIILFSFNPASIFFIAPYSECIYSCLNWWSILSCFLLYNKYSNRKYKFQFSDVLHLFPISLCGIVRSNGVLNIGFVAYTVISIFIKHFKTKKDTFSKFKVFLTCILTLVIISFVCLIPFIIYQWYCFQTFCKNFKLNLPLNIIKYAEKNKYVLPGEFSKHNQSWCHNKIPLAYSYVQNYYWNVGLFKYYKFKQIPNFLLAAPILYILINFCIKYIIVNINQYTSFYSIFTFGNTFEKKAKTYSCIILSSHMNVFVVHSLFLSIFCLLFIHIQVSTRMLCSSSPLFYWICVNYMNDCEFTDLRTMFFIYKSVKLSIIKIYFISYFVIGTLLFCNFFPWT